MIAIVEIPRSAWVEELNRFSALHEGWLVSVDVFGRSLGPHPEIVDMPLIGVSADRAAHQGVIAISAAHSPSAHVTHLISGATQLFLERTIDGGLAMLLIVSDDDTRTVVHVRAQAGRSRTAENGYATV